MSKNCYICGDKTKTMRGQNSSDFSEQRWKCDKHFGVDLFSKESIELEKKIR